MQRIISVLTIFVLIPFASLAGEGGSVALVVDGSSYEFPLDTNQSDWSGSPSYGSVNIYTRPTDEATWALFKQLTLGFTVMNGKVDAPEISLYRVVDGEMQKLFGNKDTGAMVTVEEVTTQGAFLAVSGQFSSDLGTSRNYGGDIDLSAPVPVSGTFAVTLGPVE